MLIFYEKNVFMKVKRFWNADKIVSIGAMVVSIGSLFVIVYQTNLIRKEQYVSVMPYLELESNTVQTKPLKIFLGNTGLGPALIKEVRVHYKGKVFEEDLVNFYLENFAKGYTEIEGIRVGELIPANAVITLLESGDDTSHEKMVELLTAFGEGEAVFEIVYASIYGEKWILRSDTVIPQEVDD